MRRSPIPMAVARADGLPFRAGSFDTVLAIEVLEHCPDPAAALREATRCLRSGGTLVATVPFFYPPHDLPHDYFRLTAEGLAHLVRGAGLRVRSIDPIGGVGSVLADFAIKMASEAAFGLGMAVARALRLGPRGAEVWGRALGAFLARTSGLAGAAFLAARAVTIAWIARRPTGRLRSRLDRFLADRSSRVSKGYLAIAEKPGGEGSP